MLAKMNKWYAWIKETESAYLFSHYEELLSNSGFRILDVLQHNFNPQGYTALFLLSESHFAIHTFPERGKSYVELSSCVDRQFDRFLELHDMETTEGDNNEQL